MKNKGKIRIFIMLLTLIVFTMGFSVNAYAGGGEGSEPTPQPTTTPNPVALTPGGNLTLVDDIEGEQAEDKQFITVVTRNGNYFYIIIDRAGDGENVYFLNMVDETDLLTLIEEMDDAPTQTVVAPQPEPQPPTTTEPEPQPEPETKSGGGMGGILAIVLILAAGGGAFYYFKVLKPKQAQGGGTLTELDELDFDDDNDAAFDETIQRLAEQKKADEMEDYDEE